MSSPPAMASSPVRPSKFIEGTPLTLPDLQSLPATKTTHLQTILSEMDAYESSKTTTRRAHRGSESSISSASSISGSASSPTSTSGTSPTHSSLPHGADAHHHHHQYHQQRQQHVADHSHPVKEGRRSINFSRRSLDVRPQGDFADGAAAQSDVEKLARKFKGRLRALTTGGRDRDAKPVVGT